MAARRRRAARLLRRCCATQALAEADAVDAAVAAGRDPGPAGRGAGGAEGQPVHRGQPTTCGSRILEGWRPPYDATVVELLRRAGAVVAGQDQHGRVRHGELDRELGLRADAQPARPRTRCPAAAAVARPPRWRPGSRRSAWARTPEGRSASRPRCAGWSGMKPTYGRVSRYGLVAFASSLDQIGPFATTVEDAALLFDVAGRRTTRSTARRCRRRPSPTLDAGRRRGRGRPGRAVPRPDRRLRARRGGPGARGRRRAGRGRGQGRGGRGARVRATGCRPTT